MLTSLVTTKPIVKCLLVSCLLNRMRVMDKIENRRERLRQWFADKPIPAKEKSYISQLLSGTGPFGEKAARRLENTYGMGDGYLDKPVGEVVDPFSLLPKAFQPPPNAVRPVPFDELDELPPDDYRFIRYYDVSASAGDGADAVWVEREIFELPFRSNFFKAKGVKPENCRMMRVRGDSMAPELRPGDSIIIDVAERSLQDGEIYVVVFDNQLYVKRIVRSAEGITLHSMNDAYTDINIPRSMMDLLHVLGHVAWRGG